MSTLTLEPTLEHLEQAEEGKPGSFLHAWCVDCQEAAAPAAIPSMCGCVTRAQDETFALEEIPDDICVVCSELAARACEKCGR